MEIFINRKKFLLLLLSTFFTIISIIFGEIDVYYATSGDGNAPGRGDLIWTIKNDHRAFTSWKWKPSPSHKIFMKAGNNACELDSVQPPPLAFSGAAGVRWLLLVDDAKCAVVKKARNALEKGYSGIVVYPYVSEDKDPDVPHPKRISKESQATLTSNIVFVSHKDGVRLAKYAYSEDRVRNCVFHFSESTKYDAPKKKSNPSPQPHYDSQARNEVIGIVLVTVVALVAGLFWCGLAIRNRQKAELVTYPTTGPTWAPKGASGLNLGKLEGRAKTTGARSPVSSYGPRKWLPDQACPTTRTALSTSSTTTKLNFRKKSEVVSIDERHKQLRQALGKYKGKKEVVFSDQDFQEFIHGKDIPEDANSDDSYAFTVQKNHVEFTPWDQKMHAIEHNAVRAVSNLSNGSFGIIYKGEWDKQGGEGTSVAVKLNFPSADGKIFKALCNEIKVHSLLCHPHVVTFYGACVNGFKRGEAALVMELMSSSSLLELVRSKKQSSVRLKKWALDIASGMEYIASQSIIHRDLALRNILLDEGGQVAKISDFGLAVLCPSGLYIHQEKGALIPVRWTAVESLCSGVYSEKSDVWMFGVTVWELFSRGENPWGVGMGQNELIEKLVVGERLGKPSQSFKDMYEVMNECWRFSENDRPTFSTLKDMIARCKT